MTSVLKVQKTNALKADAKGKGKRKANEMDVEDEQADVPTPKRLRNKQRVLLLSSRGITHRMRHLMSDIEALLPHVKKGISVQVRFPRTTPILTSGKIRSWTQRTTFIFYPNLQISTTVTTPSTLKHADMKTFICGLLKHPMVRV